MRRRIQSISKEQITNIQLTALSPIKSHPSLRNLLHQNLNMRLKDLQITDAILNKLRSDQLPRRMPLIQIRGKDTIAKEIFPFLMKWLAFAIVGELRGENSFDIFRIRSKDDATATWRCFNGIIHALGRSKEALPCFEVFVLDRAFDTSVDEIQIYGLINNCRVPEEQENLPPGSQVLIR